MIKGFEQYTEELSDQEILHLPILKQILSAHVGSEKAITSGKVLDQLKLNNVAVAGSGRLRKMIHVLRRELIPNLAATSKGYYIETDLAKLKEYSQSLRDRSSAILIVADSIDSHISEKRQERALKSQTNLFTPID